MTENEQLPAAGEVVAAEVPVALVIAPVIPVVASLEQDQAEFAVHASRLMEEGEDSKPEDLDSLGQSLMAEFNQAVMDRRTTEQRWLKDLRQYKGQYESDVLAQLKDRSQAFTRKTRVKVKTTDSRVEDMLFPAGASEHWSVAPTPKPSLAEEHKRDIAKALQMQVDAMNQQMAMQAQQAGQPAPAPQVVTEEDLEAAYLAHAKRAAEEMTKTIKDQLIEAKYREEAKKAIHSGHLYGTGVIKGPMVERKVRLQHVYKQGKWHRETVEYITPMVEFVPLWRCYPDMSATELKGCSYWYELHSMTRADFAELARRKSFDGEAIKEHIKSHPNGTMSLVRWVDAELKQMGERDNKQGDNGRTYEVIERWGYLSGEQLKNAGVKVPEDRCHETFFSNIWMLSTGKVIKAALQPLDGITWPYHIYYFDKDETSIFGEGIPSIMRDDQDMINAGTRMMLDNAALTAGPMFEVKPHLLSAPDSATSFRPWKAFMRNQVAPGERAVIPVQVDGRLGELQRIVEKFEMQADETTAIPRYMTGENVNSGAAATMGGMSMLMGAANIVLKDLVDNWDNVTLSFIRSMYAWNMQFNRDDRIKGDFVVNATGSQSLVAKEIRARQINELGAMTANPMDAPYIKRDRLNRLRAEAMELGDLVRSEDEIQSDPTAKMQQELAMKEQQLMAAEREAKINLSMAQAERFKADAARLQAQAALDKAAAIDRKLESVFVALQAAGIAVQNPLVAAAGDEILRSSGWNDETPDPSMAELGSLPTAQGQPQGQGASAQMGAQDPMNGTAPQGVQVQPPGAGQGQRQGIETMRNEGVQ